MRARGLTRLPVPDRTSEIVMRVFQNLSIKRKLTLIIMLTSSVALLLAAAGCYIRPADPSPFDGP
jgi:hypothetical protein